MLFYILYYIFSVNYLLTWTGLPGVCSGLTGEPGAPNSGDDVLVSATLSPAHKFPELDLLLLS